jgi:hypothetical protein
MVDTSIENEQHSIVRVYQHPGREVHSILALTFDPIRIVALAEDSVAGKECRVRGNLAYMMVAKHVARK